MSEKRVVRRREKEAKIKKHVSLRPSTVAQFERFAERHQVSFSAAVELLTIQNSDEMTASDALPILLEQVNQRIDQNMNRLAKLVASSSIESGMSWELMRVILKLTINDLSLISPRQFTKLVEGTEGDGEIVVLQRQIEAAARQRAVKRLKGSLTEIEAILGTNEVHYEG